MPDDNPQAGDEIAKDAKPEAAKAKPRRARGGGGAGSGEIRRVNIAANVAVQVLCAILLFVLINLLGGRHYDRADLSETGNYSISEATETYLSRLDAKVKITMAFLGNSKIRDQLRSMLEEYRRLSDGHVTIEEFDPGRDKAKAIELEDRYDVDLTGSAVFIDIGGRVKQVTEAEMMENNGADFAGEAAITSAMSAATEERPKRLYIIAGKGRLREVNGVTAFEELYKFSKRQFFDLKEMTSGNITDVPEDADALILINPETDFSEVEMGVLQRYWEERNGNLVLLLNPATPMPNLYEFLRKNGVWVRDTHRVLFSQVVGIGGNQKQYSVESSFLGGSPITASRAGLRTTFGGRTCPLSVAEGSKMLEEKGIKATPLLQADEKFWGDLNHTEENPNLGPGDIKPPVYVAASIERGGSLVDEGGLMLLDSSRLVVVSNPTQLDSDHMTKANQDFVVNAINWALDREERLDIAVAPVGSYRVDLSAEKYRSLFLMVMFLMPGVAFAFGVFVWSARRN